MDQEMKSEQEIVLSPLSVAAGCLPADLVKLCQVLRIVIFTIFIPLFFLIMGRSAFLLESVNVLRADPKSPHVLIYFQGHFHLVILYTPDDQRFVKREVALDPRLFHHLLRHEGFLYVAILAVAFDHDTVGDEVGLAGDACIWLQHLLED